MQRKTETDYRDLAAERHMIWTGDVLPENVLAKTTWRCARGHSFEMRFANLQSGRGCPVCSQRYRRRQEDYQKLGAQHGLELADPMPPNIKTNVRWLLPDGTEINASYRALALRTRLIKDLVAQINASSP
jgi:hypothetical protein